MTPIGKLSIGAVRKRPVGVFSRCLIREWAKGLKGDLLEVVMVEHLDGGYGLAARKEGSDKDEWYALCPVLIEKEVEHGME